MVSEQVTGLRERKKAATRRELVSATLRLVAERGIDEVTVEDISAAAGVSPRTFFNYFASKEDALLSPYPDVEERNREVVERFLAMPAGVAPVPALAEAMRPAVMAIEDDPEEWLIRMKVVADNPALLARILVAQAPSEEALLAAVATRTGLDPVRHLYPRLVLSAVHGATTTAVRQWQIADGKSSLSGLLDEAFACLTAGLPAPDPAS
ncbi:TetR/AcrR family transcriptional regulator [Amycolatopsis suaedae]|uniref:TetR family transcriptional regulator n=1 Tax=Amycolatopsis suaedae TaxID=2510978 RepID=A0A4Q7J7T8_9PSEU|nr:TetR family transcriptional regulator [Amycolatopsis suaedae]RZQ62423.1 TetR family transcriptional regulator [Amycolatopsis suaedae]